MTIISENYRLIFIHLPKCGGSSIEREFEKYCKWGDFVIGSTKRGLQLQKVMFKLHRLGKHTKPKLLEKIVEDKWVRYTTVTIIRHPRKIIESYYKFGKRREKEICDNKKITKRELYQQIKGKYQKLIPKWMYSQNRGVMIDAITAEDFNEYLTTVCDGRWIEFFNDYVINADIDKILHLENGTEIENFFKKVVNDDFNLLHENISKSEKLIWSEENLERYRALIADTCVKLGYDFDIIS